MINAMMVFYILLELLYLVQITEIILLFYQEFNKTKVNNYAFLF